MLIKIEFYLSFVIKIEKSSSLFFLFKIIQFQYEKE